MRIIIQAGGKGSRLEGLTKNKPKCLVPVNNLPILMYAFKKFPQSQFLIIADYKIEVLEKYLATFAQAYNYKIIKGQKQGTVAGIKEALAEFDDNEPILMMWSDLILAENFTVPTGNWVGLSKDFECRWSYIDGKFIKNPSKERGVAGLFVFENKSLLENIPEEGAFVGWLQTQDIDFKELPLTGMKEVGTLLAYDEVNRQPRCRPFNSIEFYDDIVIKQGISEQGQKIAADEIAWYKHVKNLGYEFIPEISEYEPLKMKRVQGKNIFEYDCLTRTQKKDILDKLIEALNQLHQLESKPANPDDTRENYIVKTFERLNQVRNLIPFADREYIKINGKDYKNVFFVQEELSSVLESMFPSEFRLIHGDCTFSNFMFDTFNMKAILIDPRGYFGKTKLYGDVDYDWAKLYYSLSGNYDQFNLKRFTLEIGKDEVELAIKSNGWEDMEEYFFESLEKLENLRRDGGDRVANHEKIKALQAVIWLSLTTYAWEDYDSICGAFYNGLIKLDEVLKTLKLSPLAKTWILDVDGTLVKHNGYLYGNDILLDGVEDFFSRLSPDDKVVLLTARKDGGLEKLKDCLTANGIRYDHLLCEMPVGERILVNDMKPSGLKTAYAVNKIRDEHFRVEHKISKDL